MNRSAIKVAVIFFCCYCCIVLGVRAQQDASSAFYLTICQGNGCLKQLVARGERYTFRIEPAEGWKVSAVVYNGNDVTSSIKGGVYTTPAIMENAQLNVTFEKSGKMVSDTIADRRHIKVYADGGDIVLEGTKEGEQVTVLGTDGIQRRIFNAVEGITRASFEDGHAYLVWAGGKIYKVAL